jgi:hypothetical protein
MPGEGHGEDTEDNRATGERVRAFFIVLARGISDFGGRVRHHQLERIQSLRASLKLHSVVLDSSIPSRTISTSAKQAERVPPARLQNEYAY